MKTEKRYVVAMLNPPSYDHYTTNVTVSRSEAIRLAREVIADNPEEFGIAKTTKECCPFNHAYEEAHQAGRTWCHLCGENIKSDLHYLYIRERKTEAPYRKTNEGEITPEKYARGGDSTVSVGTDKSTFDTISETYEAKMKVPFTKPEEFMTEEEIAEEISSVYNDGTMEGRVINDGLLIKLLARLKIPKDQPLKQKQE